jgi:hypothetical protein
VRTSRPHSSHPAQYNPYPALEGGLGLEPFAHFQRGDRTHPLHNSLTSPGSRNNLDGDPCSSENSHPRRESRNPRPGVWLQSVHIRGRCITIRTPSSLRAPDLTSSPMGNPAGSCHPASATRAGGKGGEVQRKGRRQSKHWGVGNPGRGRWDCSGIGRPRMGVRGVAAKANSRESGVWVSGARWGRRC